jgi:hypothetical protein
MTDMEWPKPAPEKTPNQFRAEEWAARMVSAGFPCKPMRTQAIGGVQVRDGWVVNIHDQEAEAGVVAAFWGRGHFRVHNEFVGKEAEAGAWAGLMAELLQAARQI